MSDRLPFPRTELRRRTVRGAMVTAGFLVGIDLLVLVQGLVVTRLLGPSQIGNCSTPPPRRMCSRARGSTAGRSTPRRWRKHAASERQ
jgi:hypothetical protein